MTLFFLGLFYVSKVSCEDFYNFVSEDREFMCRLQNVAWFHPNGSRLVANNMKYHIEENSLQSILAIKNINAFDIGEYKCAADGGEEKFNLNLYCKLKTMYEAFHWQ